MPHPFELAKVATFNISLGPETVNETLKIQLLRDDEEREVLAFLAAARSVQSTFMTGLIRDNGLESPFNRGVFYGARRASGEELAGVALVGHSTLIETADEHALVAFARVAKTSRRAHVIMLEEEKVKRFWRHYARGGQRPRIVCREMLFELSAPVEIAEEVDGLRLATLDDLAFVMPVQACMALEESGVDPMERDAVGFRLRCARRIEQRRVWVWIENGRLIFKADILADTNEAVYMEGVYISPAARNQSHGSRCVTQMARQLLTRTRSIKLLVNEQNIKAQQFYRRAGFRFGGYYDTIFLQPAQ